MMAASEAFRKAMFLGVRRRKISKDRQIILDQLELDMGNKLKGGGEPSNEIVVQLGR